MGSSGWTKPLRYQKLIFSLSATASSWLMGRRRECRGGFSTFDFLFPQYKTVTFGIKRLVGYSTKLRSALRKKIVYKSIFSLF